MKTKLKNESSLITFSSLLYYRTPYASAIVTSTSTPGSILMDVC